MKSRNVPHDSAVTHVAGKSIFIDDRPRQQGELIVGLFYSTIASGILEQIDVSEALLVDGVHGVYTHADLENNIWGSIIQDQPLLVEREIRFYGEVIAVIAAETQRAVDEAKQKIRVRITEKEPVFEIDEAKRQQLILGVPRTIERGDVEGAFADAPHELSGIFRCNGQDHFYLESHAAIAYPKEQGQLEVHSSSQHPTETQHLVAKALGLRFSQVVCIVKRMGGGFGGKEAQAAPFSVYSALVAARTGRAARCVITKDDDMIMTGNRHPFQNHWRVCFDDRGLILGMDVDLYSNGGAYADLSTSVMERAMLHAENAYFVPNVRIKGTVCRCNIHPNTAFRGFGGPQGIATIESVMEEIALALGKDSWDIRRINCYQEERNIAPYGQIVENNTLPQLFDRLHRSSNYASRRQQIEAYNQQGHTDYRGLSMTAVKFGISFTSRFLNQGNALVTVQTDGSIQVSTGGTEMGQGLNVKIRQVVASCFGIYEANVQVMPTSTEKNHNTSPTAASSGSDINCAAAQLACQQIADRLKNIAAQVFLRGDKPMSAAEEYALRDDVDTDHIALKNGDVINVHDPKQCISFPALAHLCYMNRISLGGYAFYKTPGIFFDKEKGIGRPFLYYTNGVCCSEVSIDRYTGELKVLRSDILMDLGRPINEGIDYGQVCGAFVQGMGWASTENVFYDENGRQVSHSPTTYKIPNIQDIPRKFTMNLIENHDNVVNIRGSKAVGEPPLVLGISVWTAAKDALRYSATADVRNFKLPATNEEVLQALGEDLGW